MKRCWLGLDTVVLHVVRAVAYSSAVDAVVSLEGCRLQLGCRDRGTCITEGCSLQFGCRRRGIPEGSAVDILRWQIISPSECDSVDDSSCLCSQMTVNLLTIAKSMLTL